MQFGIVGLTYDSPRHLSVDDCVNRMALKEPKIVNSRLIAGAVFVWISFSLAAKIRNLHRPLPQPYAWKLLSLSFSPSWAVTTINLFFYFCLAYIVVRAFVELERSDERVVLLWFGAGLLHPLPAIWPAMLEVKPYMHLALIICAWMAATSLVLYNFMRTSAQASGPDTRPTNHITTND